MSFFDLNIRGHGSEEKPSQRSLRLKLAVKAMELGYTGIAYNNTVKGIMSESDRCSITLFPISKLSPSSSSFFAAVKFHRQLLNVPVSCPFRQYTRLTAVVDMPSQALAINAGNPILKSYDIVCIKPMNQNVFDQACQTSEVDMIAINFTENLPFRLKYPMVKAAMERGVYFEITYSGFFADTQSRRRMLSNCKMLVDCTRGKNLIFSSAASSVTELRGPLDVANLFSLIGINTERARAAVSKNCRCLVARALRKKHFYKEAIKVEEALMGSEKSSLEAWLKWDPISSGEGDLSLEDLEKSFAICNASSENTKPEPEQLCTPNESLNGREIGNFFPPAAATDEAIAADVVRICEGQSICLALEERGSLCGGITEDPVSLFKEDQSLLLEDITEKSTLDADSFALASLNSEDDSVEKSQDDFKPPEVRTPPSAGTDSQINPSEFGESKTMDVVVTIPEFPDTECEIYIEDAPPPDDDPSCLETSDISTKSAAAARVVTAVSSSFAVDGATHQKHVVNGDDFSKSFGELSKVDSTAMCRGSLVKCRSGRRKRRRHNSPILFPFNRFWSCAKKVRR